MMKNSMEYRGYHARIDYSPEDNCFVGKVLGIVDTLVFDGESVTELETMFRACVDDYLAMCEELGKAPDREFKGSFNVRITPELHRRAVLAAEQQGISLNQYVGQALEAYEAAGGATREITYVVPVPEKRWIAQVESLNANAFSRTLPGRYPGVPMGGNIHA